MRFLREWGRAVTAPFASAWRRLFEEQQWEFQPSERAIVPGSPAFPEHPMSRRILYAMVSVLVGITSNFSNAIISANLPYLQGALGLNLTEIVWLPTVYAITNACGGGVLFKYRQQFGVRSFALIFLSIHLLLIFAHLFVEDLASAIAVRAASGVAATALTTLALYYMMQAFPKRLRLSGVVLGLGIPQIAIPLARLIPIDEMAINEWHGLYLLEFGLSALSLGAVLLVRLPPSTKNKVFEKLDFVTMPFYIAGIACFGSAIGLGPYLWWFNFSWIGWCLAASIVLLAIVFVIECGRPNPLIDVQWLSGIDFVRFAIVMIITRIVLAEQATGAIGFLRLFGLVNENFFTLSLFILLGAIAGPIVAAIIIKPDQTTRIVMLAVGLVAIAAYFDSFSSDLTRAPQFYITQTIIAFSTTMFIGPALIFGLVRVLTAGGQKLSGFVILFAITQSIGSLIGNAVIISYQYIAARDASNRLITYVTGINPIVETQISKLASLYSSTILDPSLRKAEAVATLGQQVTLQANILAYNDTFLFVSMLAAATTIFLAILLIHQYLRARRKEQSTA